MTVTALSQCSSISDLVILGPDWQCGTRRHYEIWHRHDTIISSLTSIIAISDFILGFWFAHWRSSKHTKGNKRAESIAGHCYSGNTEGNAKDLKKEGRLVAGYQKRVARSFSTLGQQEAQGGHHPWCEVDCINPVRDLICCFSSFASKIRCLYHQFH